MNVVLTSLFTTLIVLGLGYLISCLLDTHIGNVNRGLIMPENIFKRSITHTETELLKRLAATSTRFGVMDLLISIFDGEGRTEFADAVVRKLVRLDDESER